MNPANFKTWSGQYAFVQIRSLPYMKETWHLIFASTSMWKRFSYLLHKKTLTCATSRSEESIYLYSLDLSYLRQTRLTHFVYLSDLHAASLPELLGLTFLVLESFLTCALLVSSFHITCNKCTYDLTFPANHVTQTHVEIKNKYICGVEFST